VHKPRICAQTQAHRDESDPIAPRLGDAKNRTPPHDSPHFRSLVVLLAMQKVGVRVPSAASKKPCKSLGFLVLKRPRSCPFGKPFGVSPANRRRKIAQPSSERGDLQGNRTDDLLHRDQKLKRRVFVALPCRLQLDRVRR
jgi:hypothetical protein